MGAFRQPWPDIVSLSFVRTGRPWGHFCPQVWGPALRCCLHCSRAPLTPQHPSHPAAAPGRSSPLQTDAHTAEPLSQMNTRIKHWWEWQDTFSMCNSMLPSFRVLLLFAWIIWWIINQCIDSLFCKLSWTMSNDYQVTYKRPEETRKLTICLDRLNHACTKRLSFQCWTNH
jgi:hypothetical protein